MNDRRAGTTSAPVVALALRAQARRWAEEIYNQMSDCMQEAMEDIRYAQGSDMCRLVLQELESMELETSIATAGRPS